MGMVCKRRKKSYRWKKVLKYSGSDDIKEVVWYRENCRVKKFNYDILETYYEGGSTKEIR